MMIHMTKLQNDTVVNVAQLLKEQVGATREVEAHLDRFPLDVDLEARDVTATTRLTRIATGILAAGRLTGTARVVCVRCLEEFDTPFTADFEVEYRPTIDVRSGLPLPLPETDEVLTISENHELDLGEIWREAIILALPMRPICGELCPGFVEEWPTAEEAADERLAILEDLLKEFPE